MRPTRPHRHEAASEDALREDAVLVAAVGRGDRTSLERIYAEYKDDLFAVAYHLLGDAAAAEDVLHDVLVQLARRAPALRLEGRLRPYLVRACRNRALDAARRPTAAALDAHAAAADEHDPCARAARADEADLVARALAAIPAEQREVVVLRAYGQLTFREIGELLAVSINTAQSRYRYALAALRERLPAERADGGNR